MEMEILWFFLVLLIPLLLFRKEINCYFIYPFTKKKRKKNKTRRSNLEWGKKAHQNIYGFISMFFFCYCNKGKRRKTDVPFLFSWVHLSKYIIPINLTKLETHEFLVVGATGDTSTFLKILFKKMYICYFAILLPFKM